MMRFLKFFFLLFQIAVSIAIDDEFWCNGEMMNRILNQLSELNRKVDMLADENSNRKSLENYKIPTIPTISNCESLIMNTSGTFAGGVYNLHSYYLCSAPFQAFCLADPNGEDRAWTIILRRQNSTENFARDWVWYKHGFGKPSGEYFLGLEKISQLTSRQPHELWIQLENSKGEVKNARYDYFEIGREDEDYYLKNVGNFSGNAEDFLGPAHEKRKFTTLDSDNDSNLKHNCAEKYQSAWWYNHCNWKTLTGNYSIKSVEEPINWIEGHRYAHMAIRVMKSPSNP